MVHNSKATGIIEAAAEDGSAAVVVALGYDICMYAIEGV